VKLIEAISNLDAMDDLEVVYAAEPWSADSQAIVTHEPEDGSLPSEAKALGLTYFLEVFTARDLLEGWAGNLGFEPPLQEKCARLIRYAITDA
jgi:hypothetical protein